MKVSERIAEHGKQRQVKADALQELLTKSETEGRALDADELKTFDEIEGEEIFVFRDQHAGAFERGLGLVDIHLIPRERVRQDQHRMAACQNLTAHHALCLHNQVCYNFV